MRKTVICAVVLLTASWVTACGAVSDFVRPAPSYGEVACTVVTSMATGLAAYEKIRIVGEHSNKEDWWIVFTTRNQEQFRGVDGKIHAVNFPKANILRMGEYRNINGVVCHCPE